MKFYREFPSGGNTDRGDWLERCLKAMCEAAVLHRLYVPNEEYVEIGHLMKNEYGFVSAHAPDLAALPFGKTPVFKRRISGEFK